MKQITVAPQEIIEQYEDTAREFFEAVLKLQYDECLVTDESRLSDFSSCGLPDDLADATQTLRQLYAAWDAHVVPLIRRLYAVEVVPKILLIELFDRIERQMAVRLH